MNYLVGFTKNMQLPARFLVVSAMTTSQQLCLGDVGVVSTRNSLQIHSGLIEGLDSVLQASGASTIVRITASDLPNRLDGCRKLLNTGCKLVLLDGSLRSASELQSALSSTDNIMVFDQSVEGFETRSLQNAEQGVQSSGYSLGVQAGEMALNYLFSLPSEPGTSKDAAQQTPDDALNIINKITQREKQCLQWIANGKTSKEIATLLAIAETTVNFHLRNAFTKLNASNRVHLVAKAVALGIVSPTH